MSEGTEGTPTEVAEQEAASTAKRKTLSLGDRIKVVDYLRAQVEPIVADSNTAVAAMVSDATKVDINWQQLKYMIDDPTLADMNLGTKVHVRSLLSGDNSSDARIAQLESKLEDLSTALYALIERVSTIESK